MFMTLKCAECGAEFIKDVSEYKQLIKRGKKRFFCSSRCSGIVSRKTYLLKNSKHVVIV